MQDIQKLLKLLTENNVKFVIIGGFAAIVHGSSMVTEDLDLCISFSVNNLKKLLNAFQGINPEHRLIGTTRSLDPPSKLAKLKNLYLKTDLGYVDLLSEVSGVGGYERLKRHSTVIDLFGLKCFVVDIDTLIKTKKAMGRPKDKETILQLEAIKERSQR